VTASIDVPLKSTDPQGPIVFFGTPAYSGCHPLYVMSLIDATRALNARGYRVQHYFSQGCSIITNAREEILGAFLASRAQWLAMVDSDIGWPADLILRMLELREPMMAAAVPYRTVDVSKIEAGTYADGITFNTTPSAPEELRALPQKKGFVSVKSIGTAFILMSRDAVMAMIRRYPDTEIMVSGLLSYALFAQVVAGGKHAGEDTSFFARWSAMGGQIWVVTDAEITHTGPMTIGGNLARKMEDTIDPAGRWLGGANHILRDLPGAAQPKAPATQAAPAPAPGPGPATETVPGTENGNGSDNVNGNGGNDHANPEAIVTAAAEVTTYPSEAKREDQTPV
jgi:hypothetical protein